MGVHSIGEETEVWREDLQMGHPLCPLVSSRGLPQVSGILSNSVYPILAQRKKSKARLVSWNIIPHQDLAQSLYFFRVRPASYLGGTSSNPVRKTEQGSLS